MIFDGLRSALQGPVQGEEFTLDKPPGWLNIGSQGTGPTVDVEGAMELPPVAASVRWISETIAQLPHIVVHRRPDGDKERVKDHPVYPLVRHQPNSEMGAHAWTSRGLHSALLRGNDISTLETKGGRYSAITPVDMSKRSVRRKRRKRDGELFFEIGSDSVHHSDVLSIPGPSFDGVWGYDPIKLHQRTLAYVRDLEIFGHNWFRNGSRYGGFLETDENLSDAAFERLQADLAEGQGPHQAHKWKILEEGLKAKVPSVAPNDAQFTETRWLQIEEVARIFNIPPPVIHHLLRATFSNIEHLDLMVLKYTLGPWIVRREQAMTAKLFTPRERGSFYIEIVIDGLLRSDIKSRYEAYKMGREGGWWTVNDIRRMESKNGFPGRQGNSTLVPLNFSAVDGDHGFLAPKAAQKEKARSAVVAEESLARSLSRSIADCADRATRAGDRGKRVFQRAALPILVGMMEHTATVASVGLGAETPDVSELAEALAGSWDRSRPDSPEDSAEWALALCRRAQNAARLVALRNAGVKHVRWDRRSCDAEECGSLEGAIVPVGEPFSPSLRHPPASTTCSCGLQPLEVPK